MAIKRNERTYPLSIKASAQYALNAGIVSAYDYQGNPSNAYAQGDGVPHIGTKTLTHTGSPTLVAVNAEISGRDCSQGKTVMSSYLGTNIGSLGFGSTDGKGPFTIHRRYRTPSAHTNHTAARAIVGYKDANATRVTLYMIETTTYCFFKFGLMADTVFVPSNSAAGGVAFRIPFNTIVDLHITRDSVDMVNVYLNGSMIASASVPTLLTYSNDWAAAQPNDGPITGTPCDLILIDHTIWNRALSEAEVTQHTSDPYAGYANTATVPDGLNVTNPTQGTTVNSEGFQIGGTYAGATVPTGFQYRFNGGAWTALTGVTIGGGNFSGMTGFVTAATGTLEVRYTNATAVTDSVTLITAQAPAPTVSLTSQPPPDGQNVTIVLATTRANSVSVTLQANGNGAVTQGPFTQAVLDNAATVALTGIPPGDYTVAISVTGSGGTANIAGNPVSILGVSGGGDPIGSDPGDSTAPVMTGTVTVSQIKESSFAASWTGATDNNAVTGYEYSLGGAYLPLGLVTTYLFTNQPVGTALVLSIRAIDGAGLRSNILTASFSTLPAQIPAPPTAIVATLGLAGAVSVAFLPDPTVIDNPATGYTVKASNGQQITGTASPITITMPLGFTGTFAVSATNAIGTSADSAASNQIVIASPSAPEGDSQDPVLSDGITIDLLTHDTIGVSWQGATDNVGIRNYEVTFDGVNFTNNGTATSIIKTGLKALTGYPFSVRANDDAGNTSDPLSVLIETLEAPAPVLPAFVPSSPASTRSYAWLKDAIARWSHRDNLEPMMDDFIMLAEKRINGDLQARLQVGATTIRTTAKLDGAPLPSDIAEIKALAIPGNPPLEYLPPDAFNAHYLRGESGTPKYYTVFGAYLHLIPTPGQQYDIACAYRQKIPSLLDEADGVNWLIQEQPNIYLSACMLEVIDYTKNFAEQDSWTRKYAMAVDAVNGSDWSMASSLRIRTDTRTV